MKKPNLKTTQINIRLSPQEKAKLVKYARQEEMPVSKYILACALDCGEEMRK